MSHKVFSTQFRAFCNHSNSLIKGHKLKHSNDIMPSIGIGTWGSDYFSAQEIADSVKIAIGECGYKHIDCASVYGNQYEIGQVLADCFDQQQIDRKSLHITSKIWNNEQENVYSSVEHTLKHLQLNYLNLCLIHWPFRNHHSIGADGQERDSNAVSFDINQYMETWNAMNDLVNNGLIKNIGVSNMTIAKLEKMRKIIEQKNYLRHPAVNQIECHPYFQQWKLFEYCQQHNIIVTAALPLGSPQRPERDRSFDDPVVTDDCVLKEISEELGCSVVQIIIAWHINRGSVCVPKATQKWMLQQNIDAIDIELSDDQMRRIKEVDKNHRLTKGQVFCWYPGQEWQELWDYE